MRVPKIGVALLASGALAMVLTGCVAFKVAKVKQVGKKPKVVVTFTVCGNDANSTCPIESNSGEGPGSGDWRLLIGFRVPKGTKLPEAIEPRFVDPGAGTGTKATAMGRNRSYSRELNRKAPRNREKFRYVGYSSEPFQVPGQIGWDGTAARFRVPMELSDKLFERLAGRRFRVRPVVGSYQVSSAQPANDPITCDDDPFEGNTGPEAHIDEESWRICIDSPLRSEFRNLKTKIKSRN